MGLFSFRKKPAGPFAFLIEDAFALRSGGAVVAGRMLSGSLRRGTEVLYVPVTGTPFVCLVEYIEQPNPARQGEYIHPEEARSDGPFGGHYAFRIPDRRREDFQPGGKLLPVETR